MDGVFMSVSDQVRFRIIEEFLSRRISRREAAQKLDLSERQITRIASRMRRLGLAGIKHGNCGKTPANRLDPSLVAAYIERYRQKYADFNRSHALEMMRLHEEFAKPLSYDAFNRACRKAGLGKGRKRRLNKAHRHRNRHAREGFMVQMDGSPEKWFGQTESCLIAIIDDATSKVPVAEFQDSETTWGCMRALRRLIEKEGVPEFVLTDCAGWSTGSRKRDNFSQFVRACSELDIKVIGTPSPESKGRIERSFRTMQDRLIPELALFEITGKKDANRYLEQCYLPKENARLSVEARDPIRAYRPLPPGIDLQDIFCLKTSRQVNRDHTISYKSTKYRLDPPDRSLWRKWVTVHEYEDGSINVFYDHRPLVWTKIVPLHKRQWGT